ncbi:hypothetical protein [Chryseobacterium sp.]|uniref:hypothetical protein n=1 Tax=Chryseobacterium sp. TaxID=1871047 RepID=UPI00289E872F|nr:hypothetical protein [Chryseobacterium sp.]
MNKLIIFFLLLLFSCGITKEKSKLKQSEASEINAKVSEQNNSSGTVNAASTKSNLTDISLQNNFERSRLQNNQNFTLKSNGKCAEPGTVRNVQFTDKAGNTTTIPVNDNTELNFGNQSEESKEIETLKADKRILQDEKNDLQLKYDKNSKLLSETQEKLNKKSTDTDVKTKKNSIWQFLLCAVLAVFCWELLKKLKQKYLPWTNQQ